jgi:hypothetical protein
MFPQRVVLVCLTVLAALGCGAGPERPASGASSAGQQAGTTTAATAAFGVKECDEYVTKYSACIDSRAPEGVRVQMHQALEQAKVSWRAAGATPEGRQGLGSACSQALESAKAAMRMYGCDW